MTSLSLENCKKSTSHLDITNQSAQNLHYCTEINANNILSFRDIPIPNKRVPLMTRGWIVEQITQYWGCQKIEWRNGTMNRLLMDLLRMNLRVKCREGFHYYWCCCCIYSHGFWTRQHYYLKKHKNPLYNLFTFINRYFLLPFPIP